MNHHRIAAQFYNRPLLVMPSTASAISAFLLSRLAAGRGGGERNDGGQSRQYFEPTLHADGSLEGHAPRTGRFYGEWPVDESSGGRRPAPYRRTAEGVAIITAVGEFVNRGAWIGASSGLVSYEGFKFQVRKAAEDPKVSSIILDIESPGGEAIGAFEAAAMVREAAKQKNVVAVVNGMAASAAYAIASGARRIVTMPTGISGSIGVVVMHLDIAKWLEDEGLKPTLIFAGAHKVDGNPFEALPSDVRADLQREVSSFYDQFLQTVALGRPSLSEENARATQARVYKGQDAVEAGLADAVGTFEDVLDDLSAAPVGRSSPSSIRRLSMTDQTMGALEPAAAGSSQADHERMVAAAREAGLVEGRMAGAADANTRIAGILDHAAAQGREALARHLAFKTELSVEAAVATLEASPKTEAAKPSLQQKMAGEQKPDLGAPPAPGADKATGHDPYERGRQIALRAKGKAA
jgi:signal peptide peptidase SppA